MWRFETMKVALERPNSNYFLRAVNAADGWWSPSTTSDRDPCGPDFRALAFNRLHCPHSESAEKRGRDNYAHPCIRLHVLCAHHRVADLYDLHVRLARRDADFNIPQRRASPSSRHCSVLAERCGSGKPHPNP